MRGILQARARTVRRFFMPLTLRMRLAAICAVVSSALLGVSASWSALALHMTRGEAEALSRYRELTLWSVPIALAAGVLASWWLSKFALLPLTRVADAARTIDVRTLDRRLPVRGVDDELDRVVDVVNATLGRLEVSVGHMRQFSAAMAHELRTPLAALRGEIELALRSPASTRAQRDSFASQLEALDRLTLLIDHILTLTRADSGQIRLRRSPVVLSTLALDLIEQIEPTAAAKSIELRGEASPGVTIDGDTVWLERLILNLVDNAVKFTPAHGRVAVRVLREGNDARIEVEDTGVGLSPENAQRVFERFFRADAARPTSIEGAGLGLSLVQWIAEQHGGAVAVRSRLGAGSTFTVTLPIEARRA